VSSELAFNIDRVSGQKQTLFLFTALASFVTNKFMKKSVYLGRKK